MTKRLLALVLGGIIFTWAGVALAATLDWTDNSTNEVTFRVERQPVGGTFAEIGSTTANVVTFVDPSPPSGACYRVKARNAAGDSAYSNTACLVTPPAAPGNLAVTP